MNAQTSAINFSIGDKPRLDWVPVDAIRVDENYQRQMRQARVRQILRDFDWAHFQPVMLAEHEDGTFTVFDGQHRVEAARQHPSVDMVPAAIIAFSEGCEEAQAFIGVNVNRSSITTVERYHAGIEAGDAEMMAVCAVLEEAGCEIVPSGTHSPAPNRTAAVAAISRSIRLYGDRAVIQAMLALRAAWPKDNKALNGSLIKALARIYRNNRKIIDDERMVAKLKGKNRTLLTADAEALRKIGGGDADLNLARAIVEAYNRQLSTNQITIGTAR